MPTTELTPTTDTALPDFLISIVIPIFNEELNIAPLHERLQTVLHKYRHEVIFIDDGSSDRTATIVNEISQANSTVRVLCFSRNFGHQPAVSAGLVHAKGDAIIVMDGDLQDPPEIIPQLIEKWRCGHDVVFAVRVRRQEGILVRCAYSLFYLILNKFASFEIPRDSGDFSLMSRKVVNIINELPEKERFIRGMRAWVGFSQVGVYYNRENRNLGKSKYSWNLLIRLAGIGIFSFSRVPLEIISRIGAFFSILSLFSIFLVLYLKIFTELSIPGFAATASIALFLGGLQLFCIGILGEYIGRIFEEVKNRPSYVISKTIGFNDEKS